MEDHERMSAPTVCVPLVVAYNATGGHVYIYYGAPLPSGLADGEAERLAEGGFVTDGDPDEAPAKNAKLENWQTFAKSQGKTEEDLDGLTRDEIRDLFV